MTLTSNVYGWTQLAEREKIAWTPAWGMAQAKKAGLDGWEHSFGSEDEVAPVLEAAGEHGLEMRSAYIGGKLHEPETADAHIERVVAIAARLLPAGVKMILINPDPIRWGGPEIKSDDQLLFQAEKLQKLGERLAAEGSTLLYHSHDPEMRAGAREFHHMLLATDPEIVRLCLDVHWVYRGAGNSQVALFDIIKLYATRIDELHLRQSRDHVWSETVGEGDIDFAALAQRLADNGVKAHLVLEHAYEEGTEITLDPVEAHRRSREFLEPLFAPIAA